MLLIETVGVRRKRSSNTKAVLNEGCVIKQQGLRILRCGVYCLRRKKNEKEKKKKKNVNALTAASEFFLWSACVGINR